MVKVQHRQIVAGLAVTEGEDYFFENGRILWNWCFIEKAKDFQELMEWRLVDRINDALGHTNWAISISQQPPVINWVYWIDLYTDNPVEYLVMQSIVEEELPKEYALRYYPAGNMAKYALK